MGTGVVAWFGSGKEVSNVDADALAARLDTICEGYVGYFPDA
jgi:hypothetical protein